MYGQFLRKNKENCREGPEHESKRKMAKRDDKIKIGTKGLERYQTNGRTEGHGKKPKM
jgi:hypothetical protein